MKKIKREHIVIAVSLIVVLLIGFSYAFFYKVDTRGEDVVTIGCFKTTFEGYNDINLDKAYPMSEAEGNQLTPYTFTIKNICNNAGEYQINLETKEESSLSTAYLRYKLNDNDSDILGNQLEVQEYVNDDIKESRNIEAGVILPNEEITYQLRLWVDEASTTSQSANKLYKGKVVIKTIENKEPYKIITLNANGGEISHNEIIRVKKRKMGVIEDTPEKTGYIFEGWYSDSEFANEVTENTVVTNDMDNIYAKYRPITYHVTFNTNGGAGSVSNQDFTYDSPQNLTEANLTKNDYTFAGWSLVNNKAVDFKNNARVNNLTSTNNETITLYAVWVKNVFNFEYTGDIQTYEVLADATYKIEAWGAQGGEYSDDYYGGKGGYTSGNINLTKKTLYIQVGGAGYCGLGEGDLVAGGYNGGGDANIDAGAWPGRNFCSGGGATDIRLVGGAWDNFDSLKSRIMVAAGGGGANKFNEGYYAYGGHAGGLNGYPSSGNLSSGESPSPGATQTSGYKFGVGDSRNTTTNGGGSGYYGAMSLTWAGGAGGSSFMSGYSGCNAINYSSSTASNIVHTGNPIFTFNGINYEFTSGVMVDGKGCNWSSGTAASCGSNQVQPNGSNSAGHIGNGYARITLISLN